MPSASYLRLGSEPTARNGITATYFPFIGGWMECARSRKNHDSGSSGNQHKQRKLAAYVHLRMPRTGADIAPDLPHRSRSANSSLALAYRCSGARCRQRKMMVASLSEMAGFSSLGFFGVSLTRCAKVWETEACLKGLLPVAIS